MSQRLHVDADLLAKLAESERAHRRQQRRFIVILAVAAGLGLGVILYAVNEVAKTQPDKVVIDPAKLPPIQPGPAR